MAIHQHSMYIQQPCTLRWWMWRASRYLFSRPAFKHIAFIWSLLHELNPSKQSLFFSLLWSPPAQNKSIAFYLENVQQCSKVAHSYSNVLFQLLCDSVYMLSLMVYLAIFSILRWMEEPEQEKRNWVDNMFCFSVCVYEWEGGGVVL